MGKTLDFVFQLDVFMSNGFKGRISQAEQALKSLDAKVQALQKTTGNISSYQRQQNAVTFASQRLNEMQIRLGTVRNSISDTGDGQSILASRLAAARRKYAELSAVLPKNSQQVKASAKEVKALEEAYAKGEAQLKKFKAEEQKLAEQVSKADQALTAEKSKLAEMQSALERAGVDTSKLGEEQARLAQIIDRSVKAQERYNSIRQRLSWGNIKGAIAELTPVVTALKAPIKLSADFESAMARVKAVAFSGEGADLSGFEAMKNQALQLGADTQFTAIQAAATQENLARAGMSAKNIMSALPAVLDMAAAEGMDLAQAGSIIAKGLGGMNLSGEYAVRLADVLAYTSANSNTNIAMLGEAFKVAAPIFASQGVSMEQLASYLGVLANKGYEGSEAGNAIAAAPLRLAKQNKETQVMLRDLGVAVQTRDGRLRELPDVMIALDQAMKARNYGEVKQLNVIETVFGKNYGKAMMAFMQASAAGDSERMQNGVQNNSFGQAKKMANINLDTLNGQLQILGSAWDGLRTTIGDTFSPVVRQGAELLATVLSDLNNIMKEFPLASSGVVWAFTGLASVKAVKSIWDIGSALIQLPGAWLEVRRAAATAQTAVEGTAAATKIFGMNLNTALGVLGLIAFACYEIYQHWEDITAAAQRAGEAISSIDTNKFSAAKAGTLSRSDSDYGVAVMSSTYMPPEIKNAKGGIYSRPIWTWAAEKGPEAIIPLTDKSRGVPLVMKAAQILGLNTENPASIITQGREMINYVSQSSSGNADGNSAVGASSMTFTPTYNITVNGEGSRSIGENIRAVIEDTMNEIMSRMERVSYA